MCENIQSESFWLRGSESSRESFPNLFQPPAGWILSHSSGSRGLFPPRGNIRIFRISYIFSQSPPSDRTCQKSKSRRSRKVKNAEFLLEPFVPLTLRRVGAVTPERSRPVRVATVASLPLVLGENRGREDSNSILCATPSNPLLYL